MQTNHVAAKLESIMAPPPPRPDEVSAAAIALNGSRLDRLRISAKALFNLMRDPEGTDQVFVLGIALNAPQFPRFLARFTAEDQDGRLLREQPSIDSKSVDFDRLMSLPETTLGGAFARHMKKNNLDPDLFQAPPGLPTMVAYVAKRVRQTHDIWHLLTGYDTDVPGELALQAFYYGHMRLPSSLALSVLGTARYLSKFPNRQLVAMVRDGYRRGKLATFLPTVRWEELWEMRLADVRTKLNIAPRTV